jgi:hypothetical protein
MDLDWTGFEGQSSPVQSNNIAGCRLPFHGSDVSVSGTDRTPRNEPGCVEYKYHVDVSSDLSFFFHPCHPLTEPDYHAPQTPRETPSCKARETEGSDTPPQKEG